MFIPFSRVVRFAISSTALVVLLPTMGQAQMVRSLSYCCKDETGKKVCGDRPAYCWGKEYEVVNEKGLRIELVGRPKTREELQAIREAEEKSKQEEKIRRQEEDRFSHLLGLYGSPENIDKEIERQRMESEENRKISESRLKTAKENVELFKAQKGAKMSDADRQMLTEYQDTVKAIEQELKDRADQQARSRERLLLDKKKLVDYLVILKNQTAQQNASPSAPKAKP